MKTVILILASLLSLTARADGDPTFHIFDLDKDSCILEVKPIECKIYTIKSTYGYDYADARCTGILSVKSGDTITEHKAYAHGFASLYQFGLLLPSGLVAIENARASSKEAVSDLRSEISWVVDRNVKCEGFINSAHIVNKTKISEVE